MVSSTVLTPPRTVVVPRPSEVRQYVEQPGEPRPKELYELVPGPDGEGYSVRLNLHEGQARCWYSRARITAMVAGSQSGKALALDTPIPTPQGFTTMGALQVGDEVFAPDGTVTRVTFATPVQYDRKCYRLTFDDGTSVVADADHRWVTRTAKQRKNMTRRRPGSAHALRRPQCQPTVDEAVVTTRDIAESRPSRHGGRNHSIDLSVPFEVPDVDLPVPPYTLGVWLGDGDSASARVTTMDPEVLAGMAAEGVPVGAGRECNSGRALAYALSDGRDEGRRDAAGRYRSGPETVQGRLRALGVLGRKHIPPAYLFASKRQRLALLRGLMDTDGSADRAEMSKSSCEFSTASDQLARDVLVLLAGLGVKARRRRHQTGAWRIVFTTDVEVFSLPRKAERIPKSVRADVKRRYVYACERVDSVPVRCITVEHPSHQYLCTESFLPTHNTALGPWYMWSRMVGIDAPELGVRIPGLGGGMYLAVSPNYDLTKLKLVPELLTVFEHVLRIGRWWAGDRVVELKTPPILGVDERGETVYDYDNWAEGQFVGERSDDPRAFARVLIRSANVPGGLESATAKFAWLDEAGQKDFTLDAWEAVLRRLSLSRGPIFISTTPYMAGGWLKTEVVDRARNGDPEVKVVRVPSIINPQFPLAEWEERKARMNPLRFAMMYEGKMVRMAGLVYPDFSAETMTVDAARFRLRVDRGWQFVGGIDFGWHNPFAAVLLARSPDGVVYVMRTYRQSETLLDDHAAVLLGWERALPGDHRISWFADPSGKTQIEELRSRSVYCQGGNNDVLAGIDAVTELMRTGRFWLYGPHPDLVEELDSYTWETKDDNPTDKPRKAGDHLLDALRYGAMALSAYVDPAGRGSRSGDHPVTSPRDRFKRAAARTGAQDVKERVLGRR